MRREVIHACHTPAESISSCVCCDLGANSLIITVFGEEEQPGDGCEHALELVDRAAIAAAFPAEHPPCLHLCHGVLDGGADLAEDRVEFTLPVQEFRSAEALEWHDPDAVDSCPFTGSLRDTPTWLGG